jgi:hypothetical protein
MAALKELNLRSAAKIHAQAAKREEEPRNAYQERLKQQAKEQSLRTGLIQAQVAKREEEIRNAYEDRLKQTESRLHEALQQMAALKELNLRSAALIQAQAAKKEEEPRNAYEERLKN